MKRPYTLRVSAIALSLSLVLGSGVLATDVPPGGFGGNVPPPPPGGGSMTFYTGDAVTDLESGDYTGEVFPDSTGETEVALRVGPGVTATLTDSTVTKTAGDMTGDDGSFYGVNSGVLAYSEDASTPAELTIQGGKVETSANGANGVFAYGSSTINLENATVTISEEGPDGRLTPITVLRTNRSGFTTTITLPTVSASLSLEPGNRHPYTAYTVQIVAPGFFTTKDIHVPVYSGVTSVQPAEMLPLPENYQGDTTITYPESEPNL
mgnify:CR=1 FL=1